MNKLTPLQAVNIVKSFEPLTKTTQKEKIRYYKALLRLREVARSNNDACNELALGIRIILVENNRIKKGQSVKNLLDNPQSYL